MKLKFCLRLIGGVSALAMKIKRVKFRLMNLKNVIIALRTPIVEPIKKSKFTSSFTDLDFVTNHHHPSTNNTSLHDETIQTMDFSTSLILHDYYDTVPL